MANYSPEQIAEIEKILKYIQQMEGIVRTSPSQEQVARVRKQMGQYANKLIALMPHVSRNRINVDAIRSELGLTRTPEETVQAQAATSALNILEKFAVEPASPHSSDYDVNFTATVLRVIQREYWPVITDLHCKLDFSHSSERDAIRIRLDSTLRNLKVLTETIEEYALAEKQDFREQLLKMKSKQTRVFLYETNDVLKKIRDFLQILVDDYSSGGNIIMNKKDIIKFNTRFEEASVLEGAPLDQGIREFEAYVSQAIEKLNLPQIKIKEEF